MNSIGFRLGNMEKRCDTSNVGTQEVMKTCAAPLEVQEINLLLQFL